MAEGRRAAAWQHTGALLFKLHKAHFKDENATLADFNPYAEHADPYDNIRMVSLDALKTVVIDGKMPEL